ncbi:MAG: DUF3418 domain-containing protein, partial [Desulfatiglandales bacterium]|nr:DUF3418 domain-containing protein [Desulfatiglandales bacterium]
EALGGDLCRSSYADPHWEKNRGEVRANEQVILYGLVIVPKRSVSYGSIDPEVSHKIFIQSALLEGQLKESFPFLVHNRNLMERISGMEDKVRHRGILVSDQVVADFYSERLPGLYGVRSLKKRIKERGGDDFLKIREEDLLLSRPNKNTLAAYPDQVTIGEHHCPLSYTFAPGTGEDGVTITIPATLASRFPAKRLEWMVPGFFKEKITVLIKGLPKGYRKQLVPVSRTAEIIVSEMEKKDEPLLTALARFTYRRFGVDIPASIWTSVEIPDHLKMRLSITDHRGRELQSGRDVHLLRQPVKPPLSGEGEPGLWNDARKKWEKSGIMSWNFGSLPEQLSLGPHMAAYPCLEPGERCVNIRICTSSEEAHERHKKGVETLFCLHLSKDLKFIKRVLVLPGELTELGNYFGGLCGFEKALYDSFTHRLFHLNIRTEKTFFSHVKAVRPTLVVEARKLVGLAEKVLHPFYQTSFSLHDIETANRSNRAILTLCAE